MLSDDRTKVYMNKTYQYEDEITELFLYFFSDKVRTVSTLDEAEYCLSKFPRKVLTFNTKPIKCMYTEEFYYNLIPKKEITKVETDAIFEMMLSNDLPSKHLAVDLFFAHDFTKNWEHIKIFIDLLNMNILVNSDKSKFLRRTRDYVLNRIKHGHDPIPTNIC